MFGMSGGLFETRAALLASRGFATLALACVDYEDLPTSSDNLDVNYFVAAVDWLSTQPYVQAGGIGVVGLCKGGEMAFLLGSLCDKVKVVVSVSGSPALGLTNLIKDGEVFMKTVPFQESKIQYLEEGISTIHCFPDLQDVMESVYKMWQRNAKILYMCGGDDKTWNTSAVVPLIEDMCPREKRKNITFVMYQGAGHLIEPPYMPLCRSSRFTKDIFYVWGGQPKEHAAAQEDAWRRLLDFLHQHLHHRHTLRSQL